MSTHIIRKLSINDYNHFFELINDFRQTNFTEEKYIETLSEIKKSSDIWVIEYNNKLIGTATIIYEHKFIFNGCILAHIEDVCIKKEFRNSGFGKILMNRIIQEIKDKNCYKVSLDCMENNVPFYEKCGFERRGQQMTILF
jgi:glucosamine-phosphate N-acetyltransferase